MSKADDPRPSLPRLARDVGEQFPKVAADLHIQRVDELVDTDA